MIAASTELSQVAGWTLRTLLCCRHFFHIAQLVLVFNTQIQTFVESCTSALHHAAPTVLNTIHRVQRRLLRQINLSELKAFKSCSLAPLLVWQNISMLCFLYRIADVWRKTLCQCCFRDKSSGKSRQALRIMMYNLRMLFNKAAAIPMCSALQWISCNLEHASNGYSPR